MAVQARKPAKPRVAPYEAAVQAAVTGSVRPLQAQQAQLVAQRNADIQQSAQLGLGTMGELAQLRNRALVGTADLLNLAAQRQANAAGDASQNQQYLQQMLSAGNPLGNTAGVDQAVATRNIGDLSANTQNTWDLGLQGTAQRDFLNREIGTAALTHQHFASQRLAQAANDMGGLALQIAQAQGQAPLLRRQYQTEDRQYELQRVMGNKAFGLQQQQFSEQQAQNQFGNTMTRRQFNETVRQHDIAAGATKKGTKKQAQALTQARIDKYAPTVADLINKARHGSDVQVGTGKDAHIQHQPGDPAQVGTWTDMLHYLVSQGIPVEIAKWSADQNFPQAVRRHQGMVWDPATQMFRPTRVQQQRQQSTNARARRDNLGAPQSGYHGL